MEDLAIDSAEATVAVVSNVVKYFMFVLEIHSKESRDSELGHKLWIELIAKLKSKAFSNGYASTRPGQAKSGWDRGSSILVTRLPTR